MRCWTPLLLATAALLQLGVDACTVIAAGRDATVDGSTLVAHTDDAGGGAADLRLVRVPAQDHAPGSRRAVYNFFGGFPRVVTHERGAIYSPGPADGLELSTPMGSIPQVAHTFAYFDQDYGMMNEAQLSIGESTCGARTVGWPLDAGPHGKNLFGIAELTKVALERCDSARCAITTMGSLATDFGFYSEDSGDPAAPDFGDSAEALAIADKFGELWVFHILTGANNTGAVWAAQRVRDDHVTTIANGFTIRELDLSDPDWFLASDNVESFAQDMGWFDPAAGKRFDFTAAYGDADKDAVGPLYTGRRVWRVFDVLAPSLRLDSRLGSFSEYATYPFSVKPDALVAPGKLMELMGDHYEGTPYDMTKGVAAGPFGAPVRWAGKPQGVTGGWERPISMFRTMFSFVLQARSSLPDAVGGVVWYAQDQPHGSVYVPFSCAQHALPASYVAGKQSEFDRGSAWWAFNFVNNWSVLRFNAINADVRVQMQAMQQEAFALRERVEGEAMARLKADSSAVSTVVGGLEASSNAFATSVVDRWWAFGWTLVAKFSDGYVTTGEQPEEMLSPGYPAWWLEVSGFSEWPGDSFTPKKSIAKHLVVDSSIGLAAGFPTVLDIVQPQFGPVALLVGVVFGAAIGAAALVVVQNVRRRGGYRSLA